MATQTIIEGGLQFLAGPLLGNMIIYMPYETTEGGQTVYKDGWTYYSVFQDSVAQNITNVQIVNDIDARNALNPTTNIQVYVVDASADPLITSGGAFYIYQTSDSSWLLTSSAGVSTGIQETFETVSKNMTARPGTIVYTPSGDISAIDYGGIVKTLNYNVDGNIESIVLSGPSLPPGILLTKTFTYNVIGDIESWSYS